MRAIALTLTLAGLSAAATTCPTYVARSEAYAVGTVVTYNGANYKVANTMSNGWTGPDNTWFWNATTEDCAPVVPQPTSNEVMDKLNALDAKLDLILSMLPNQIVDTRDGKTYGYVKIGTQTWMSQNLNIATATGSWCYENKPENCAANGRLYDWNTAKSVCPQGWHLPSEQEWGTLISYLNTDIGSNEIGKSISSLSYGTDDYGFSAKITGYRGYNGSYGFAGSQELFWSKSTSEGNRAICARLNIVDNSFETKDYYNGNGFSVRCTKN